MYYFQILPGDSDMHQFEKHWLRELFHSPNGRSSAEGIFMT